MVKICDSKFWDTNLTWNAEEHPDFTSCFEKTVLVFIPCCYLWVFAPIYAYTLSKCRDRDIPWSFLNITKIIVSIIIVLDQVVLFIYKICLEQFFDYEQAVVDYLPPGLLIPAMMLQVIFVVYDKKRGVQSAWYLFIFWLLMSICELFEFRTNILELRFGPQNSETFINSTLENDVVEFQKSDPTEIITVMIFYTLVIFMLILNCFADRTPQYFHLTRGEKPPPELSASFLSKITFSYLNGLIWKGFKKPIEQSMLCDLPYYYSSESVTEKWNKNYQKSYCLKDVPKSSSASYHKDGSYVNIDKSARKQKTKISVFNLLVKTFGLQFFCGSLLKFVHDLIQYCPPLILGLLITFTDDPGEPMWRGYLYAATLFLITSLQSFMLGQYFRQMYTIGFRIRTAIIAAVYKKALLISNSARKKITVGEVVNLMSVDAQRFLELVPYLNLLWSAPLQIAISTYLLWNYLGVSVFAGLGIMVVLIPLQGFLATKQKVFQIRQMKQKDERIKMMNEILNGIKVLKLYAWEPSFEEIILDIRHKEAIELKKNAYLNAFTSFFWNCTPYIVSLVAFAVYVMVSDEPLTSKKAFVSITLFDLLRFPISALPMMISSAVQVSVSIKRMDKFINADELDPDAVLKDLVPTETPIEVKGGYFSWKGENEEEEKMTLRNINFSVKKGTLVAVVGSVGAGKSSLCSAILGEMNKAAGTVNIHGTVAYVPQQAWIQNATLRDNILFGKEYKENYYNTVIEACALKADLDILQGGDQTEIGEKGINLSGGQKQRVNLARSVYNNASILLLDDPLSAVDSHVGKHIFDHVIGPKGILQNKTRILVTHSLTYLRQMDYILVVRDGEISEQGTFKELLANKGKFQEFLLEYLVEEEEAQDIAEDLEEIKLEISKTIGRHVMERQISQISIKRKKMDSECSMDDKKSEGISSLSGGLQRMKSRTESETDKAMTNGSVKKIEKEKDHKIIETEKAETGKVSYDVYCYYIKAVGIFATILTFLFTFAAEGLSVGAGIWLAKWSEDTDSVNPVIRNYYLRTYGGLRAVQCGCLFLAALILYYYTLRAAVTLHKKLLQNMMQLPMSFFDTNPVGRILNRFSKDIDTMDNTLPFTVRFMITGIAQVIATFAIISYTTPPFIAVMIPLLGVYYMVQLIYVSTSRQLRRIESIARSPIYSHFGETIQGAATIRAYNKENDFILESQRKVDINQVSYYPAIMCNRWLALRLEFLGNCLTFSAALFVVMSRDSINGGSVGLAISYALSVTQTLNYVVRMVSDLETNIVGVERVKEYTETTREAPRTITQHKPPKGWPNAGVVKFQNYSMRYREGLDLVIKNIDVEIQATEKIGIVGRTGAGKSSLTLALFRIIEAAGGTILIDGIDISKIGLHDLRQNITIIPQDPVLFSGTLRMNLDPSGKFTDQQIWNSLENSHLKEFVSNLESQLQYEISEGGENLSVGQRQLVCLTRALLRKTKVLVLDEATAAVDLETDDLIQKSIRKEFSDCTVITIAHRLNTIMDSTRVLVLDKGQIKEFDSPTNLLTNEYSIFYGMAKDAGLA